MGRKTSRTINFTKAALDSLEPPQDAERVYHYDEKVPGLAVCVGRSGSKSFYLVGRFRDADTGQSKVERVYLGGWPELTVEQARTLATAERGNGARGINPNAKKRKDRQVPMLGEVFEEFLEMPTRTKAKRPKRPKTKKDYRLLWDAHLATWKERKLSAITRNDIERLHNEVGKASGPYTANRVLALVKAMFNSCIDSGRINGNPASRLRPFEEHSRERFLQADELPRFWAALEAEPSEKIRDFILLSLFTGQRRSNVLAMRWDDVNLERGLWSIPQTKTGKHTVPLTAEATAVLTRRSEKKTGDYVFPGRHGAGHLTDPMGAWKEILKRAGISDLRLHDLRRSLGSWQAKTGASLPIIGKTLGHTRAETTQVYSRMDYDPVLASMTVATNAILAAAKPPAPEPQKTKSKRRKSSEQS